MGSVGRRAMHHRCFHALDRSAAVAGVALNKAAGFEVVAHGFVALMANPTKRADHLASTDDPIDECVAVLANGESPTRTCSRSARTSPERSSPVKRPWRTRTPISRKYNLMTC